MQSLGPRLSTTQKHVQMRSCPEVQTFFLGSALVKWFAYTLCCTCFLYFFLIFGALYNVFNIAFFFFYIYLYWNEAGLETCCGCTTVTLNAPPPFQTPLIPPPQKGLIVPPSYCFSDCSFCLSAVLEKNVMCINGEQEFHIPIHILYWFINRHFYKTKSSCLNKREKILMSKILCVGFFITHLY